MPSVTPVLCCFFVLASRRSSLNVRPFQLPNSSSGVEEVGGGVGWRLGYGGASYPVRKRRD